MSYEEEFDKIVRQKAEEVDYPFDAGNWEKAREMMDTERTGAAQLARKKLYLPIASVLGVLLIGISTYLFLSPGTTEQLIVSQKSTASSVDPQTQINPPNKNETNTLTKQNLPSAVIAGPQEESKQTNRGSFEQAESAILPNSSISNKEQPSLKKGSENGASKPLLSNSVAQEQKEVQDAKEVPVAVSSANDDGSQKSGNNEPPIMQQAPAVMAAPGLIAKTPQQKYPLEKQEENRAVSASNEAIVLEATQKNEILIAEDLLMRESNLPLELTEQSVKAMPLVLLKRYDDEYYSKKLRTYSLNAELGGNYLLGWKTNNGTDGAGINWFAGLNYNYFVTGKASLGAGIQAYNMAHIQQPFYGVTQKEYGFGYSTTHTLVTATDLYYVSVPLRFSYMLTEKHQFGLGFNAAYLVQSKNSISTYKMDEGEKTNTGTLTTKGVYEGISRSNYMASLFYTAHFNNRFALNTEFTYGLTDIFKNMGDFNNHENSMGIRLSLQYTLIKK